MAGTLESLGEAYVEIVVDLGKYEAQLNQAKSATRRAADNMAASLRKVGRALIYSFRTPYSK